MGEKEIAALVVFGIIALMAYYVWKHPDVLGSQAASTAAPVSPFGRKVGCYKDAADPRAMIQYGNTPISPIQCAAAAKSLGHQYMGLQDGNINGVAQCFTSNDWSDLSRYGAAASCLGGGGAWINAVYDVTA